MICEEGDPCVEILYINSLYPSNLIRYLPPRSDTLYSGNIVICFSFLRTPQSNGLIICLISKSCFQSRTRQSDKSGKCRCINFLDIKFVDLSTFSDLGNTYTLITSYSLIPSDSACHFLRLDSLVHHIERPLPIGSNIHFSIVSPYDSC